MVQVFFVMLFFPVIMNALQYYIIDGFIKNQQPSEHEPIPSEDGEAEEEEEGEEEEEDDEDDGSRGHDQNRISQTTN